MKRIPISIGAILCSLNARAVDLSGGVFTTDGRPVKDAAVFIYTAGPKAGTASFAHHGSR